MLRRALLLLSVLLAASPLPALAADSAAASPIVFNGLLVQGGVTKVSLYNPNRPAARSRSVSFWQNSIASSHDTISTGRSSPVLLM